jgi:hypothetical protein
MAIVTTTAEAADGIACRIDIAVDLGYAVTAKLDRLRPSRLCDFLVAWLEEMNMSIIAAQVTIAD